MSISGNVRKVHLPSHYLRAPASRHDDMLVRIASALANFCSKKRYLPGGTIIARVSKNTPGDHLHDHRYVLLEKGRQPRFTLSVSKHNPGANRRRGRSTGSVPYLFVQGAARFMEIWDQFVKNPDRLWDHIEPPPYTDSD